MDQYLSVVLKRAQSQASNGFVPSDVKNYVDDLASLVCNSQGLHQKNPTLIFVRISPD